MLIKSFQLLLFQLPLPLLIFINFSDNFAVKGFPHHLQDSLRFWIHVKDAGTTLQIIIFELTNSKHLQPPNFTFCFC